MKVYPFFRLDSTGGRTGADGGSDESPRVANLPLTITCDAESSAPDGVIVAQGGREQGFALHLAAGRLAFDVRINGAVTRLSLPNPVTGRFKATASLNERRMTLALEGSPPVEQPSPGLIPVQPKDARNVGWDAQTAAGDYEPPNRFRGTIHEVRVLASPLERAR